MQEARQKVPIGRNVVIPLDGPTLERLLAQAAAVRRPAKDHAAVLLRQALGLPFPYPIPGSGFEADSSHDEGATGHAH
jgi:hypothetical protein